MFESITLLAPIEEELSPWEAFPARTLLEANRQWEACRLHREGVRSRYQTMHPNSRLMHGAIALPDWGG